MNRKHAIITAGVAIAATTAALTPALIPPAGATTARLPDAPVQVRLVFPGHPRQHETLTVPGPAHLPSLTYPKVINGEGQWPQFSCAGGYDLNHAEWVLTCVWHPGTP